MPYSFSSDLTDWTPSGPSRKPPARRKRAPIPAKTHRPGPVINLRALFGTWDVLTPQQKEKRLKTALNASPCAQRSARREVMFATRATGAGAIARKKHFTNRKC